MNDSGERMVPGRSAADIEKEHWARYEYAAAFVSRRRIADIACGTGYGSRHLMDAGAELVVGVDLDPEAIAYAREHYGRPGITFLEGSAEKLSGLEAEQFDVVVSFETIEHLPNVDAYLSEIRRVLKPSGVFLVSTPDRRLASVLFPFLRRPQNRFHVREYTHRELLQQLDRDFFVRESLAQVPIHRFFAFWPVQLALKTICRVFRRFGGDRLKDAVYGDHSGVEVKPLPGSARIPKYWVVRCERR